MTSPADMAFSEGARRSASAGKEALGPMRVAPLNRREAGALERFSWTSV